MRTIAAVLALLCLSLTTGVLYQIGGADVEGTVTRVEIQPDTDATLVVQIRTRLDTSTDEEAFDRFARRAETNTSAVLSDFRESVTRLVERAENSTGRTMEATNFSVGTRTEPLPVRRGVVEYRFDWSNFSSLSGDSLVVNTTLSGYILTEDDSLVVSHPDGYVFDSVSPEPDEENAGAVRWNGPREFATGEPRVAVSPSDDASDPVDASDADAGDDASSSPPTTGSADVLVPGAAVLAVALVAGGVYLRYRRGGTETPDELPDTERVMRIVESSGGRVKQKRIKEETGWSAAKVSQVTSKLEDEGEIEKLSMGRENVIRLDDDRPS